MGLDIPAFERDPLNLQFYIDTVHCVTRRKRYNSQCLYDTFTEYCDMDGVDVKKTLLKALEKDKIWFTHASAACLGMRGVSYVNWVSKLERPRTWPDEYTLYCLCVVFQRNAVVINARRP